MYEKQISYDMQIDLKNLIQIIKTGSPIEIKVAQKQLEEMIERGSE